MQQVGQVGVQGSHAVLITQLAAKGQRLLGEPDHPQHAERLRDGRRITASLSGCQRLLAKAGACAGALRR